MTPDAATDLIRQSLILCMVIAGPVLIVGLVIGVIISVVQALTQIQEQSLTLIPKILAMTVVAVVLMPWICQRLMDFTSLMFTGGAP